MSVRSWVLYNSQAVSVCKKNVLGVEPKSGRWGPNGFFGV